MYRHADGRMETADRPLRRHTVFAAKTNNSFNDPLGWNLCACQYVTVYQSNTIPNKILKWGFKNYKACSDEFHFYG